MSKCDSQSPLANQSWLSHTQKEQVRLQVSGLEAVHKLLTHSFLSQALLPDVYGTVWISHIQIYFQVFDHLITGHIWLPAGSQALAALELLLHMQMTEKWTEVPKLAPQAMKLKLQSPTDLSHSQGFLRVQEEQTAAGSFHTVKVFTTWHNLYECLQEGQNGHHHSDRKVI